jgi:hypothetical protein
LTWLGGNDAAQPATVALNLQRMIGNRAVTRLIHRAPKIPPRAKPSRQRPPTPSHATTIGSRQAATDVIQSAFPAGSLSETQWQAHVDALQEALKKRDKDAGVAEMKVMADDLATIAEASAVLSTSGGINFVDTPPPERTGIAPGINVSLAPVGASGETARTTFVNDAGVPGEHLTFDAGAVQPETAVILYTNVFSRDKAAALTILRHEMLHAEHESKARAALREWLSKRKGAGKTDTPQGRVEFEKWIRAQAGHGRSAVDIALIIEEAGLGPKGVHANSEVLAHVEGFMTMFHLEDPTRLRDPKHSAWTELTNALEVPEGPIWRLAAEPVRNEALGLIQEYYCDTLDEPHREVLRWWVEKKAAGLRADWALSGKAAGSASDEELFEPEGTEDTHVGKIPSGTTQVNKAGHEEAMLWDFVHGLQEIIRGNCNALRPSMRL